MKFRQSRLQTVEEKKSIKQAVFFLFLTIVLLLVLFFLGIPLFIKAAVWLGNSDKNSTEETTQGLTPPQPRLLPLSLATNSATLKLEGFAMSGSKVKLTLNQVLIKEITIEDSGEFQITNINLKPGKNEIKLVSVSGDKESEPFVTSITYDNQPPALEISSPQNNQQFFDKDKEVNLEGKTDPNCLVTVNNHLAIIDSEGNFSIKIGLNSGENSLEVISQNEAGNKQQQKISVTYTP